MYWKPGAPPKKSAIAVIEKETQGLFLPHGHCSDCRESLPGLGYFFRIQSGYFFIFLVNYRNQFLCIMILYQDGDSTLDDSKPPTPHQERARGSPSPPWTQDSLRKLQRCPTQPHTCAGDAVPTGKHEVTRPNLTRSNTANAAEIKLYFCFLEEKEGWRNIWKMHRACTPTLL